MPSYNKPVGGGVSVGAGVGVNPKGEVTPNIGANISHNINSDVSVGAGVGVNPRTGTVGPSVGGSYHPHSKGDVQVGVGVGAGLNGVGITPTAQIGSGKGAETGGQIGATAGGAIGTIFGPVGTAAGSLIGSAVGSVVGGQFNPGKDTLERKDRNALREAYKQAGVWGTDHKEILADGSIADFSLDSQQGKHAWKYGDKRTDKIGNRELFAYETDYTNDTDYVAGMAGITLSRILSGKTGKSVDQMGNLIGNKLLGKVGYGADMTPENFDTIMANARGMYAKSGIQTKEEALSLANKMLSESRISDTDYAVMQQTAGLVFDNDFNKAQSLMGGRFKGVETANQTPSGDNFKQPPGSNDSRNRPGRIYSRIISPEEAIMSVQPYFDWYRANFKPPKRTSGTAATIASGIGAATGLLGLYNQANKASGGSLSSGIGDLIRGVTGSGQGDMPDEENFPVDPTLPDIGEGVSNGSEYTPEPIAPQDEGAFFEPSPTEDYLTNSDF